MKTIYKYQLQTKTNQTVNVPEGAKFLTVKTQNGEPCLWAEIDPSNPITPRKIAIHGTGHLISDNLQYISTFEMSNGNLVFHAFERIDFIEKVISKTQKEV